jgi:hypothetical protein
LIVIAPQALALLGIIEALATVDHQHVQRHVLGHAHSEIGIDDADQRHVGEFRVTGEMINAGAEREDCLQIWECGQQAWRRLPGTGIGDVGEIAHSIRPQPDVALRRQRAEARIPACRIPPGDGKQNRGRHELLSDDALCRRFKLEGGGK